jgi:siroheme synthase-like protein
MTQHVPVLLNVKGRRCVVVGGGAVALRKVTTLREKGADVRLVSPEAESKLADLCAWGEIAWDQRAFQPDDLADAFLVVAATDDPAVNAAVAREARTRHALVNVVDDPEGSDYQVPSYFEDGGLLITVSTSGQSPAVARTLRRMIQEYLGSTFAEGLRIIGSFREKEVKTAISSAKDRVRFWEEAVTPALLNLVRKGKLDEVKSKLEDKLRKFQVK